MVLDLDIVSPMQKERKRTELISISKTTKLNSIRDACERKLKAFINPKIIAKSAPSNKKKLNIEKFVKRVNLLG
jgi:hypothetical protein